MTTPNQFILTSDFASLKNDAGTTVKVTFPGSSSVAGGSYKEVATDVVIGTKASINRTQISSSKDANTRYAGLYLSYTRTGTHAGVASPYTLFAFVYRTSPTTLRCSAYVANPYAGTLTTAATDETFTFYVDTFIPPFAA